jgi:chloride channel 3/4/5
MPTGYRHLREDVVYEEDQYELTEDGRVPLSYRRTAKYEDGNTIDWLQEDSLERERSHALQSQAGIRGILLPFLESARMWFVVIMTGVGIGIAGAWLDVLVKWYVFYVRLDALTAR